MSNFTREDALALRAVGLGLVAWARSAAKKKRPQSKLSLKGRAQERAAKLKRLMALPYVKGNYTAMRIVIEKYVHNDLKKVEKILAYQRRHVRSMQAWRNSRACKVEGFPLYVEREARIQECARSWGYAGDITGYYKGIGAYGYYETYPISYSSVYKPTRIKYSCPEEGRSSWQVNPADVGFAYWSISDRSYHDVVQDHADIIAKSMKEAYTKSCVPLYRGCALRDHLAPGELVKQDSVACFTADGHYAENIGGRSGANGRHFYMLRIEAGAEACSMDSVYRDYMGEEEWRFAPGTIFEVVSVEESTYYNIPMYIATIRPSTEKWADRSIPYDRIIGRTEEELEEALLNWEEDLLAMVK